MSRVNGDKFWLFSKEQIICKQRILKKTQICLHSKEYLALYLACISTVTYEFCEFRSHALETILITIHPMKNGEMENFEFIL